MANLSTALAAQAETITKLMEKCKDTPAGMVQPTVDEIVEICLSENLAYKGE